MSGYEGMPQCFGAEWGISECKGCIFFDECYMASDMARKKETGGAERTYTREQLAHHVWRMREKSGCTYGEIARAMRVSTAEARRLYKEAMR